MAESTVQSNNKSVVFRGHAERERTTAKAPKRLSAKAKHMHRRGMISDKALAKLKG